MPAKNRNPARNHANARLFAHHEARRCKGCERQTLTELENTRIMAKKNIEKRLITSII